MADPQKEIEGEQKSVKLPKYTSPFQLLFQANRFGANIIILPIPHHVLFALDLSSFIGNNNP